LIAAIDEQLEKFPGVYWTFSAISDNMEEAVSGVKGELAVKLYGDDLRTWNKGEESGADGHVKALRILASSASLDSPI